MELPCLQSSRVWTAWSVDAFSGERAGDGDCDGDERELELW